MATSFDLFFELSRSAFSEVSLDRNTYYKEESNVNCYIIKEKVYSTAHIFKEKDNKTKKKYPLVRFINFNAKEYVEYRNHPTQAKNSNSRERFLSTVLHTFLSDLESKFSSSDAIREVMMSAFSILICVLLTEKNDYKFKILGGLFYSCSPTYGVLIPLMMVNSDYENKGLGKHFLRSMQKCTMSILRTRRCLVWFTYDNNNDLLSFYRKLGFHPAITSNFAIEHSLPLSLLQEINAIGVHEYLIECVEDINTNKKEHAIHLSKKAKQRTCDICGLTSKYVFVCRHKLKDSSFFIDQKATKKRTPSKTFICGIQICYCCNSQFGVSPGDNYCVFHQTEMYHLKYSKPTAAMKQSRLYSKDRHVNKKVYEMHQDTIAMGTNSKNIFYKGYNESFNPKTADTEIKCRHCFLIENKISYACFQSLGFLQAQTPKGKNESKWKHLNYIVNNRFEFKNQHELTGKLKLHLPKICPISKKKSHNLFWDENIGRPSTLLQNCTLGIKNVYGFGDCGVLSLLLPMLSAPVHLQNEIYHAMNTVYKSYDHGNHDGLRKKELFSIKGIRSVLCYAKLHSNRLEEEYDFDEYTILSEEFNGIKNLLSNNNEDDSETLHFLMDSFRAKFALTYEDEIVDGEDGIYWLSNSDMMNFVSASKGMICVLGVTESTTKDIEKNQFNSIIHDFGYYATCEKHILKKAKYFILLRHIDGQHFDYFYDRRNQCALFEINFDQTESIINYILQFSSPTQYFELTGKEENPNNPMHHFGNEINTFYRTLPDFDTWKRTFESNKSERQLYIEDTGIKWIFDAKKYLKKAENILVPVILFPKKFEEEPRLNLLLYVQNHGQNRVTLFDHNKQKLNKIRMNILCKKLKEPVIDLENVALPKVVRRVETKDIRFCEQFISYQVFALKVYNTGRLVNAFYSDHFGSGDIFRLRKDEEFLQEACWILSRKHDKNIKKTQLYFIYKIIKEQKMEQKLYFDYYYDFDMKAKPTMLQEWFYRTNPEYCLNFDSNTDDFWYIQNTNKKLDNKRLYYLLLDVKEANLYWEEFFKRKNSQKKTNTVKNILQYLQNIINSQFPTITVNTTTSGGVKNASNTKSLPFVYNSVKWLSFFQNQDSSIFQGSPYQKEERIPSWVEKKIMGFYLLSSLMEHDKDMKYSLTNKKDMCFTINQQAMLRDSLLFYCGYSNNDIKEVFDLSRTKVSPPRTIQRNKNTTSNTSSKGGKPKIGQKNETNQNTKSDTSSKGGKPKIGQKKEETNQRTKSDTSSEGGKPKIGQNNLNYALYVIAEANSSADKILKIELENLSIVELTEKCKEKGLLLHPKSEANKVDKSKNKTYERAFDIARNAAVQLIAQKLKASFTEIDEQEGEISKETVEKTEELIIKKCFGSVVSNQQAIPAAKKEEGTAFLDTYIAENLQSKMKLLSNALKFEKIKKKPFEYDEDFNLEIHHTKELQDDSTFLYDYAKSEKFDFKVHSNPRIKLNHDINIEIYYEDLLKLGEGKWLNDSLINGVARVFQQQIPETAKIKIFETTFYTLAEITDYNRLSTIFFNTKYSKRHEDKTLQKQQEFFHQYDILLVPMNIVQGHWYLIYMHLKEKKVYVIDSMPSQRNRSDEVMFLLTMLCTIVDVNSLPCEFFTVNHWLKNSLIEVPEFPQQNDGFNCGIFVLMTIFQVLRHKSLKKLLHPHNADKFRKYVFDLLVDEHMKNGGEDQPIKKNQKPENIAKMNFSNVDKDVEEFIKNDSQQYIAKFKVSSTSDEKERAIANEIIQVDAVVMDEMRKKYFRKILQLMKYQQLQQAGRGDIMGLWPRNTVTPNGKAFLEYYPTNSTIVYPDFTNYVSIYNNTARLYRYYTEYLSFMKKTKNNESTINKSELEIPNKNQKKSEGLSGTKESINQTDPDTISSNNDISQNPTTTQIPEQVQSASDVRNPFSDESEGSESTISDTEKDAPTSNSTVAPTVNQKRHQRLRRLPTKSYIPGKKPRGKNLQLQNQIHGFDLETFEEEEKEEEPEETLMDFLFDSSDLHRRGNDEDNNPFQSLLKHVNTFKVAPSEQMTEEEIKEEEDSELRDEFSQDDDGQIFSLEHTIQFFMNQLRMKFLMRVKKSDDIQDDDKYIYFISRCNNVRKELVQWHTFYKRLWTPINSTFLKKWLTQPFPKVPRRKYKRFTRLNSVEKEAYLFIRDWNKSKNRNRTYKWFKFTNGMRKQYQVLTRKDFRTVIETYCPVQNISYHETGNTFYGEYYFQNRRMHFIELDDDFFQKNHALIKYKVEAKQKPGKKISLHFTSSASRSCSSISTQDIYSIENAINYPIIKYPQGSKDTCLERSVNSVLSFRQNNLYNFDQSAKEKRRIKNKIGNVIREIDLHCKRLFGKEKLNKINNILQQDHFFDCEKFPKKKRNRNGEFVDFDILSPEFDKGFFTICQLCGSDGNRNHTVTITKEWIFDTNLLKAMPLNKQNLDRCCGQLFDTTNKRIIFEKCTLAYRYKYGGC